MTELDEFTPWFLKCCTDSNACTCGKYTVVNQYARELLLTQSPIMYRLLKQYQTIDCHDALYLWELEVDKLLTELDTNLQKIEESL